MKDEHDTFTRELPSLTAAAARGEAGGVVATGAPRGRGRPRKLDALTPAQRAQRYRDKKKRPAKPAMWRGPNGETWTGRGLQPRWFRYAREAGYNAEFK